MLNANVAEFLDIHVRILTHAVEQAGVRDHHILQGPTEIMKILGETMTGEATDLKEHLEEVQVIHYHPLMKWNVHDMHGVYIYLELKGKVLFIIKNKNFPIYR